jgi:hypothetical protein
MNTIDFTKNGGYRFKQFTLRKMQEAYFLLLKAFVAFCNVPEEGNFIIAGMKVVGNNITGGYAYIDGELCQFQQTAGTDATKIKKNVVIQSLGFRNGNNENVFRFVTAVVAEDGTPLSEFIRVSPVFDANYVHTDNNYTTVEKQKLAGIETGAEVNVQADWNVINPQSDAFIRNKPIILDVLASSERILGDIGNGDVDIFFDAALANADYDVLYSLETTATNAQASVNTKVIVHSKTTTGFKVRTWEPGNISQNLTLKYIVYKP